MRPPVTVAVGICVMLSACTPKESTESQPAQPAPTAAPTPAAPAAAPAKDPKVEAQEIFNMRCTPCHGAGGKGDGAASAGLDPKPRDLTSAEWQKSVTDDHIDKIIMYGGVAVGKSAAMPANPDLSGKEDVVKALRDVVRGLGK